MWGGYIGGGYSCKHCGRSSVETYSILPATLLETLQLVIF